MEVAVGAADQQAQTPPDPGGRGLTGVQHMGLITLSCSVYVKDVHETRCQEDVSKMSM